MKENIQRNKYTVCFGLCTHDILFVSQARDVRTNEVVAIKKMSYNGKQSNEVR